MNIKSKRILSFIAGNFTLCGCLFFTLPVPSPFFFLFFIFFFLPWRSTSLRILYRRAKSLLFNEGGSQQSFERFSHSHLLVTWCWGYQLQRPASSLASLETSRGIIEYTALSRKHKDNVVPPLPFPHINRMKTDDGLAVSNWNKSPLYDQWCHFIPIFHSQVSAHFYHWSLSIEWFQSTFFDKRAMGSTELSMVCLSIIERLYWLVNSWTNC